jgi:hypothetical protein
MNKRTFIIHLKEQEKRKKTNSNLKVMAIQVVKFSNGG